MLQYFPVSGRLIISDDARGAHVIFDTDDSFLCVNPSDVKIGSQVVPARTASSQGVDGAQTVVDVETTYLLAQIAIPGAKVVRGMMRSTWDSNPEPADNLWRQASGTHLDVIDGVQATQVPQSDTGGYARVATMGGYTFEVDDLGNLILRERLVARARDPGSPGTTFNRSRRQATISFRLLIGFFLDQDFAPHPVASVLGYGDMTGSGSSWATSIQAGHGFSGRRLVAVCHAGTAPSSVTIGGVTATKRSGNILTGTSAVATVWDALVPNGTMVTVTANTSQVVDLFGVANVSNVPPVVTSAVSGAANTISLGVSVGSGEVAVLTAGLPQSQWVGMPIRLLNLTGCEWRTAHYNFAIGAGLIREGTGSTTVTGTWSGPTSGSGSTVRKTIVAVKYAA